MPKKDKITKTGVVSKVLPNRQFRVQVGELEVLCTAKGHLKQANVQILEGDSVEVLISTMDTSRGFVNQRLT